MKKKSILIIFLLLLLSISLASAVTYPDTYYKEKITQTKYCDNSKVVVTQETYAFYEDRERYTTKEFRHGYTYRETQNYWKDHHTEFYHKPTQTYKLKYKDKCRTSSSRCGGSYSYKKYKDDYYDYKDDYYGAYYNYHPTTGRYTTTKCSCDPPRNKLFYFRCPNC